MGGSIPAQNRGFLSAGSPAHKADSAPALTRGGDVAMQARAISDVVWWYVCRALGVRLAKCGVAGWTLFLSADQGPRVKGPRANDQESRAKDRESKG